MSNEYIKVNQLQLIFGKGKKLQKAQEMAKEGHTNQEIRKKTKCAVGVRNVDFTIKKGELFVIVGLSGSGKSSLIRCFNLLNKPTSGDIVVDGKPLNELTKSELLEYRRNTVSMVFQSFGLLSHRSVLSNVQYGLEVKGISKEQSEKAALEAIEVVGLKGWEQYYPSQLSGGMKQRVGLARAIANEPEILLMDEPYGALDPLIRREMQNELLHLEDYIDKTIIFITHDMNEAFKLGDRIALMKDGEIVQMGKPSDFFQNPASSYVEDFIADVDKTKVLRAKQIMNPVEVSFHEDDSRTTVRDRLLELEKEFGYVTDKNNTLLGYVTLDSVKSSRSMTIKTLINTELSSYKRNDFINDLIPLLQDNEYDVPVVDSKNRLRGTICYEALIDAIA